MLRSALLLPIGIALVTLTGCAVGDDGPRVSQTRHVDAFTRIDNRDSADVRLHVGERQRVRVRAGDKVIDDVGPGPQRHAVNHVVFAEPGNKAARQLAADAMEQLGYQAESATWRNSYILAAHELRKESAAGTPRGVYRTSSRCCRSAASLST